MQWSCGLLFQAHLSLWSAQLLWHTWSRAGSLVMASWPPGELMRKHLGCWETRDGSGSSTERCLGLLGDITYPLAAMLAGLCPWATMAVDSWLHFWLKILLYVGTTDVVKHGWSNRYSWKSFEKCEAWLSSGAQRNRFSDFWQGSDHVVV